MRLISPITITAFSLMYFLTAVISLHTPMHSDDYTYAITGIGIESHFNHYFSWSGRVIADYVSGLLLSVNHTYRSLINATALPMLSFLIANISSYFVENKRHHIPLIGLIVFLTYWLSNTNLGQTTFWVVGSANYIWTNIFICLFIMFLCKRICNNSDKVNPAFIFILGVFAGCSNENTGFVAVMFPIYLAVWHYIKNKNISKELISYTISSGIGYLLLVGSPGNKERAKYFTYWYDTSFMERLKEHLYHRVPDMISQLWVSLLVIAILLIIYAFNKKVEAKSCCIMHATFFMACALLSVLIMVASPTYPPRSGNGTLVFLLIAISFLLSDVVQTKNGKILSISLLGIIALYFIPSYMDMKKTYAMTSLQDDVRQKIIQEDIKKGVKEFAIPDFYFGKMLTPSQKFDTFHSDLGYGKFYGVHKIYKAKSNFDYSIVNSAEYYSVKRQFIPAKANLIGIYVDQKSGSIVLKTDRTITAYNYINGPKISIEVYYQSKDTPEKYEFWPESTILSYYSWTKFSVSPGKIKKVIIIPRDESKEITRILLTL